MENYVMLPPAGHGMLDFKNEQEDIFVDIQHNCPGNIFKHF